MPSLLVLVVWLGLGVGQVLGAPVATTAALRPDHDSSTRVVLVHAVVRHGARTPVDTFPTDPYFNYSFAPVGWGQLSNGGKMAQFQQGEWLRRRYDALLGDTYSPKVLEVRSTDTSRTLMSAQLELAGLWPPSGEQRWHPTLDWQPIPVHTVPIYEESLLLGHIPCPGYYQLREEVLTSDPVRERLRRLNATELYSYLSNVTGLTITNPDDVQSLYSTLKAEEEFGLPIADWIKEFYPEQLEEITARSFEYNAYNLNLKRIKGGPLLKKIYEDTIVTINGPVSLHRPKFYLYVGHDATVANLLMSLGVWETQIPSYGILALIEVHKQEETEEYGIKVYLRNSTDHMPYPLTIPGCQFFCPISKFGNLINDVISDNFEEICQVDNATYVTPKPSSI